MINTNESSQSYLANRAFRTSKIRPEAIEFAKNWIADLRSGNFKQGTGKLHRRHGDEQQFCCLGVACKRIFDERLVPNFVHKIGYDGVETYGVLLMADYDYFYPGDSSAALLPQSAGMFLFEEIADVTNPRVYLTSDEFAEFRKSELGRTMVPSQFDNGDIPLWGHAYSRYDLKTKEHSYEFSLMSMNDNGIPFTVIADMIEKYMLPTEDATDA